MSLGANPEVYSPCSFAVVFVVLVHVRPFLLCDASQLYIKSSLIQLRPDITNTRRSRTRPERPRDIELDQVHVVMERVLSDPVRR